MIYTNADLAAMHAKGLSYQQIADATGLSYNIVRGRVRRLQTPPPAPIMPANAPRLPASPYPRYDAPLSATGDALILNDLEVPFHHADFVNRCLDLCAAWNVHQLILGGDVMHLEVFSAWGAAWQETKAVEAISEEREVRLRAFAERLPAEQRAAYLDEITALADGRGCADDEIKAGAKVLKTLAQVFPSIYYVLGNHDDRFLRKLNSPMTPQKLLDFLGLTSSAWHIASYYYGILTSGSEKYRVEHQRGAGLNVAIKLADKYECHIIAAHSHLQSFNWSTSGNHYAISSGCAVDESRLAYSAQRSTNSPMHKLGAVIVREGVPFLLEEKTPWKRFEMMK